MTLESNGPGGDNPPGHGHAAQEGNAPRKDNGRQGRWEARGAPIPLLEALGARKLSIDVETPGGKRIQLKGYVARALIVLTIAGRAGAVPQQWVNAVADMASAVRILRGRHGINVETLRWKPGTPTRYRIGTDIDILEVSAA